jgi:glycosyltransferase involved in cell wall biosynthesis
MKIVFFIRSEGDARGGHYHSLNHISKKLSEANGVRIITIGNNSSCVLTTNSCFWKHIYFYGFNILHLKREIRNVVNAYNPDIYHCFDVRSYNVVRLFISSKKHKIILNKCGGPNPIQFPYIHNLIIFSEEDQIWFKNQKKFKKSQIFLIPNRVTRIVSDLSFMPIDKDLDSFIFMRICRISLEYKKSILDSISLIEYLFTRGNNNIKFYLVGVVQDIHLYNYLREHPLVKKGIMFLLTEELYTTEGSRMLYLADVVIGLGRGLMEAASLGKPVLTINANDDFPVLVNDGTLTDAFRTNFSERNLFERLNKTENLRSIERLVRDKTFYLKISKFSLDTFDLFFNLDKAGEKYQNAYHLAKIGERYLIADSNQIIRCLKDFFVSFLRLRHKKLAPKAKSICLQYS